MCDQTGEAIRLWNRYDDNKALYDAERAVIVSESKTIQEQTAVDAYPAVIRVYERINPDAVDTMKAEYETAKTTLKNHKADE